MALVGILLLIGIVKKNAIMMIDFALEMERQGKTPLDAIHEAALLRFRPIMMTTAAALLGAVPLAFGTGTGSELRRPLGVAIVGGLIVSQMLTLFTTPVVYLYLDRFQTWPSCRSCRGGGSSCRRRTKFPSSPTDLLSPFDDKTRISPRLFGRCPFSDTPIAWAVKPASAS